MVSTGVAADWPDLTGDVPDGEHWEVADPAAAIGAAVTWVPAGYSVGTNYVPEDDSGGGWYP